MKDEEMAEEYKETVHRWRDSKGELVQEEDVAQAFLDGLKAGRPQWHLTKNELPELQAGNEYSDPVLCFRYHINNYGKKIKVYDLDRWNSENDIWEISGMKKDQIEAWMYLPEPPEGI